VPFVASADAPDGGRIALQLLSQRLDALAGRHAQEDPGMLDLEPRSRAAARKPLQDGDIIGIER
jgi:hypothetical protein